MTNSFTDDFIGVAEAVRPHHLYTGPATRLVRRKDLGEQLGRRLGLLGVIVHTKELPDGINPGREPGSGQWSLLCMFAENDVRQTLTRLLTGRIFHTRRNEWLAGPGALPLGFVLESDDRKIPLVGTPDDVARARLLISLAARAYDQLGRELLDGEALITPEVIVKQLSDAGARKRSNKKADKLGVPIAGAPLDTVSLARPTVMSLLEPLAAYGADGVLVRKQVLPMQGLTRHDVHGMTIYRPPGCSPEDEHRAKGVIFFQWTFPKPSDATGAEEPWADTQQLEKAAGYLEHLTTVSRNLAMRLVVRTASVVSLPMRPLPGRIGACMPTTPRPSLRRATWLRPRRSPTPSPARIPKGRILTGRARPAAPLDAGPPGSFQLPPRPLSGALLSRHP